VHGVRHGQVGLWGPARTLRLGDKP
jgi:hypothetical protein